MTFCKSCGKPLTGDERFCVHCGADVTATTPAAGPAVLPQPMVPGAYGVPGQIPVMMMPPAPVKKGGRMWMITSIVLAVCFGLYYLAHRIPPITPAEAAAADAALAKQQAFDCNFQNVSGNLQVSNGKWTNNSTAPIQSATLECDQTDTSGGNLNEMRTNLKSPSGPLMPGTAQNFNPFQMGEIASNASKVHCSVVEVVQPETTQQ